MLSLPKKSRKLLAASAAILLIYGGVCWKYSHYRRLYSPGVSQLNSNSSKSKVPLASAVETYNSRKYKQAEDQAISVVKSNASSKDIKKRKEVVQARYVLAFSAARRKDMELARERFSALKLEASKLPDKGKQAPMLGMASPTFEEEGAFQHAVCTAAMGDKKGAESEYIQFMHTYPESPLIHGAIKRIEMLHNGHLPTYAEAKWTKANSIAIARQQARDKKQRIEQSQCGPECLAEFLKRYGKTVDAKTLATEMKTGECGTSMLAMSKSLKKRGFAAKGLMLTQKGLSKQPLPLIALVAPGHYVIVDSVSSKEVDIWDPYGKGVDKPSVKTCPLQMWLRMWSGVALVVKNK